MSSEKRSKGNTTRRGFVKEVSAGAAAIAGALTASAMLPPKSMGMANFGPVSVPALEAGELKYRKCFLNELRPEEREKGFGAQNMFIVFSDNDIIKGCQYFSAMYMGESATKTLGHGPHKHDVPEVLVALGSDPNNPRDLGGKFDLYMGEEMEKHVIDQPTLIYIPANTVHCPFTITEVRRPFIFIQAHYGLKLQETAMRNLVPEELRNKYIFIDADGKQKDVYVPPSERAKRRLPQR